MSAKKFNSFLAGLGDPGRLLVPCVGVVVLSGILAIIGFVFKILFLVFFSILLFLCTLILLIAGRRLYNKQLQIELQEIIYGHLKKCGLRHFDLKQAIGVAVVPYEHLRNACFEIYKRFARQALRDFVITENERKVLYILGEKLFISPEFAKNLEDDVKGEAYDQELRTKLSDGVLTKKEAYELNQLRKVLGLSDSKLHEATKVSAVEGYKVFFRRFATDGLINVDELEELRDLARSTGVTAAEAANISPEDALNLYRRTISIVCQDGIVTAEEQKLVDVLQDLLQLPIDLTEPFRRQFNDVKELDQIRRGKLPQIRTHGINLKSTELCHWYSHCTYNYETRTRVVELAGNLIVTNKRLIFSSAQRGIEFSLKRILNIQSRSNAILLKLTSSRGQGIYYVENAKKLGAILEALIRRYNYIIAERLDNARSRHIPDEVKIEVWQRDGGKCVKCGATDYLEFDHIIPFSKGGASSGKNVQLLCRKCNLAKGGELV